MSSGMEYYCQRTPPESIKIDNVRIGSCYYFEIDPHRVKGYTCQYCKYMKVYFPLKKNRKKKEPIPEPIPVEIDVPYVEPFKPLTDLDILDIIGETGLEIS